MIVGEHLGRLLDLNTIFGGDVPRHRDQPINVRTNHTNLWRCRRDAAHAVELLECARLNVFGHAGGFDLLAQLIRLRLLRILFAKFALDRLELFAQEVFALALIHLGAHIRLNLPLDLENLNLSRQERCDVLESRNYIDRLKQLLALIGRHVRGVRRHVGEQPWVANVLRSNSCLRWHRCARSDVRLHLRLHTAHQRFNLNAGDLWRFDNGALQHERGASGVERLHLEATLALHNGAKRAVGKVHDLRDLGECAHRMQLVDRGDLLLLWLTLGDQRDPATSSSRGTNGGNALVAANL